MYGYKPNTYKISLVVRSFLYAGKINESMFCFYDYQFFRKMMYRFISSGCRCEFDVEIYDLTGKNDKILLLGAI